MSAKHTQRPWTIGETLSAPIMSPAGPVAYANAPGGASPAEHEANALLIAAAPDLLEVVDWLAQTVHRAHHAGDLATCEKNTCQAARAAIAKATGTTP